MADYNIRLGTTLRFSKNQELDLIKNVMDLTDRHKLGAYINELLRYVWEHPEKFEGTVVDPYKNNISMRRKQFFDHVELEVKNCKRSLDYMYSEMIALNTAAKVGATLGLVESTDEFLLGLKHVEGYIRRLRNDYDLNKLDGMFESENTWKVEEIADKAADILVKMMMAKRCLPNNGGNGGMTFNVPTNTGVDAAVENVGAVQNNMPVSAEDTQNSNTAVVNGDNKGNEEVSTKEEVKTDKEEESIDIDLISEFCGM